MKLRTTASGTSSFSSARTNSGRNQKTVLAARPAKTSVPRRWRRNAGIGSARRNNAQHFSAKKRRIARHPCARFGDRYFGFPGWHPLLAGGTLCAAPTPCMNNDPKIHGILVQLPLPGHLDEQTITQAISPGKDVDGFHFVNIGKLSAGHTADAFVPCTPAGCILMIEDELGNDFSGLNAVVIGRSNIVGKPMAALLLQRNATVTVTHSRTKDLAGVVRHADIVIAAVGRPEMVKADWIKPGAVVIDVGINRVETEIDGENRTKLTGDVDYDDVIEVAGAVTPVPGGVGPMTITMLMFNTLRSARLAAGLDG